MARFPTTHWSPLGAAGQPDAEQRGELLTRYLPALKAHLVYQQHLSPDDATDLLQSFVTRMILEQEILTQVTPGKGKFRTWLLTVLDRYALSERRSTAGAVSPESGVPEQVAAEPPPSAAFDQAWARTVLAEVLVRMQAECAASKRPDLWGAFEGRVLTPTLEGTDALPYDQLVERLGFTSPVQASNALITAKRMFVRLLRDVIGEYAPDRAETDEEIRDLQRILAGAHAG